MSKIKVNQIEAATGSTITIPSGQTLDLSGGTITLPNSSVNLTTKVTGTLPVANGGTGLTTIGTANQVLRVNSGATALEFGSVSSDYVKLATLNPSSATDVSFDNYFTADYDNYKIIGILSKASGDDPIRMRFKQSGSSLGSNYYSSWTGQQSDGTAQWNNGHPESDARLTGRQITTNTSYSLGFELLLTDPNNNVFARYKNIYGVMSYTHEGGYHVTQNFACINTTNTSALSGFRILTNGGNFTGRIVLYGIK